MIYLAYLAYWLWTFDCPTSKELRWRFVVVAAGFLLVYCDPIPSTPKLLAEFAVWFDVMVYSMSLLYGDTRLQREA